jgi:hypothetical protein
VVQSIEDVKVVLDGIQQQRVEDLAEQEEGLWIGLRRVVPAEAVLPSWRAACTKSDDHETLCARADRRSHGGVEA